MRTEIAGFIRPTLDLDIKFGFGARKLVETAIKNNIDLLRQGEPDISLLRNLEIASRVLLDETVINPGERLLILKDIWPEWYRSLSGDKSEEANFHSLLIAIDYNLLTGNQITTPEHIDRLKRGARNYVISNYDGLFANLEKRAEMLTVIKRHTREFVSTLREDAGKKQIDFLRIMADIIVKESSIEVTSDGAID